jgi:kinesin family protein 18/19
VRDLLCPDSGSLELREDASGSITVSNLLDISASSTDVVLGMLRMGNTNRTSEPTVANKTSSRSHAILKVIDYVPRIGNGSPAPINKLFFQPVV